MPIIIQLKLEIAKRSDSSKNEGAMLPPGTDTINELKRAFELVEVSSPGIAEQLMSRIFVRLQHRWVRGQSIDVADWLLISRRIRKREPGRRSKGHHFNS